MILKASNSSLLKPTLYENLATSRNALCSDLKGRNAELPLLSIASEASKSSGLTYIIRPVRDVIIFFSLVSDITYLLSSYLFGHQPLPPATVAAGSKFLVVNALEASSNPTRVATLLAVAFLTISLSPGPITS